MKFLIACMLIGLFISFQAKSQEKNLIQLTGTVEDELLQPMPYAHLLVMENFHGTITNPYGHYSLVVEESDSVLVSAVGYKTKYIVIPKKLSSHFLKMDIVLQVDTLVIAEARIYPWKNYEEFKEAFVNLKLPTDDMERARRNIALIRTQIIMDQEPSARANFEYIMEKQYERTFTQGQFPSYQLFNVIAWAKFFQALKRGDFKYDPNKHKDQE